MAGQVTVSKVGRRNWKTLKSSLLIAVMALVTALSASPAARAASGSDQVVATVGDRQISEAELNDKIAGQVAMMQNKLYEMKKKAIEAIADDYLAEQEAKKANISKEAYLKREIDDKAPPPSEAELKKFYEDRKAQIHKPYDEIKAQIAAFLTKQAVGKRRQELFSKLQSQAGLKIMLEPPRLQVAADG